MIAQATRQNWFSFLAILSFQTLLLISVRVVIFILIIYFQHAYGLAGISLFGAFTLLPTLVILPVIGIFLDKIHFKKAFILSVALLIPLIHLLLQALDENLTQLRFILFLTSLAATGASIQAILFDKYINTAVDKTHLSYAVNLSRLSNTLSYFLGPIIAGIAYLPQTLPTVNLTIVFLLFLYLGALFLLEKKDPVLHTKKPSHLSYFFRNKHRKKLTLELLFTYTVFFIWINAVTIICLPYFKATQTVAASSTLIGLSGAGGVFINLFMLGINLDHHPLFIARLTCFSTGLMLILLAVLPPFFEFFALSMFLGGAFSTYSFILSQYLAQKHFYANYLGGFFSLRTWISSGMTIAFYFVTGFALQKFLIPSLQWASNLLGIGIQIEEYQAIQAFFIFIGSLIIFLIVTYRFPNYVKKALTKF